MSPIDKVRRALELMDEDGDWPSPQVEEGPQARRAEAMQRAITLLAEALLADLGEKEGR